MRKELPLARASDAWHPAIERKIFWLAVVSRVIVIVCLLTLAGGRIDKLSRDSYWYDLKGVTKAEEYARGEIVWKNWIDEGWYEFVGLVYFVVGPNLLAVLLINAALSGFASGLAYRVAAVAFENEPVARVSAYIFALFPSIVYFTSLPLKEAAALVAHMMTVWGILQVTIKRRGTGWLWLIGGMSIVAMIRVYLFYVLACCLVPCFVLTRPQRGIPGIIQVGAVLAGLLACIAIGINVLGIDISKHEHLHYFDLDYVNSVRNDMSEGKSKMFSSSEDAGFGGNLFDNVHKALLGLWYFFMVIDITNIRRERQLAAVPEMIFFLFAVIPIIVGSIHAWRRDPKRALPILLWSTVLVLVYSGATTNGGAMYRWRIQAMPFLIMLVVYGCWVRGRGFLYNIIRGVRPAFRDSYRAQPAARVAR